MKTIHEGTRLNREIHDVLSSSLKYISELKHILSLAEQHQTPSYVFYSVPRLISTLNCYVDLDVNIFFCGMIYND